MYYVNYTSPLGELLLVADRHGLRHLYLPSEQQSINPLWQQECIRPLQLATDFLNNYFAGLAPSPDRLLLAPVGTPFQQQVWQQLLAIPYAQISSYGAVAENIGNPKAVRAVGGAIGANPLAIIIPCHRVLGKDRSLTGYSGGLPIKTALLTLEGIGWREKP
ncbi:MAG: methylated-DNA--[protein]-cysteine S-methyltransferase [Plesiomonas sp.]